MVGSDHDFNWHTGFKPPTAPEHPAASILRTLIEETAVLVALGLFIATIGLWGIIIVSLT